MKLYHVLRDNAGYMGRYWKKDAVIELPDDAKPPVHFELISKDKEKEILESNKPKAEKPTSLSELGLRAPEKPVTAGRILRDKK